MDKCPPRPECPPKPDCPKPPAEQDWNIIDLHKERRDSVTNNVTINHNEQVINRVKIINYCGCGGGGCGACSYRRVEVAPCVPRGCREPMPRYTMPDYYAPPVPMAPPPWQRRMGYDCDYGPSVPVQPLVWYPDRMSVEIQAMPWYPDRMPMYVQPVTWYPQDDYYARPQPRCQPYPRNYW